MISRSGLGPAPDPGKAAGFHCPGRGQAAHALDQVVYVGVEGGEVAAGAGGDPTAQGRVPEGLGEVAQGHAVRLQGGFELGAPRPALDAGRPRYRIDFEHPAHAAHVHGDDAVVPFADVGGNPAHHRRAASVGHQRRPCLARPFHQRRRVGFVARVGDRVGGVGEVTGEDADRIGLRLSEAVQNPLVGFLRADRGQPGRRVQAGRPQCDLADRRRPASGVMPPYAEAAGQGRKQRIPVAGCQALAFVPPSPVLEPLLRVSEPHWRKRLQSRVRVDQGLITLIPQFWKSSTFRVATQAP